VKRWLKWLFDADSQADVSSAETPDTPAGLEGPSVKLGDSNLRAVKCQFCYRADVVGVCHHCGRFLCRRCQHDVGNWFLVDRSFAYLSPLPAGKLKRAAHCCRCVHKDLTLTAILAPAWLLLAAVVLVYIQAGGNWTYSLAMLLAGTSLLALAYGAAARFRARNPTFPHGFPLFCKMTIELQEEVKADFDMTGRSPHLSYVDSSQGFLRVKLHLKPADRERYDNAFPGHRSGHKDRRLITFHAGVAALETLKHVKDLSIFRRNLLLLTARMTVDEFTRYCLAMKEVELERKDYEVLLGQVLKIDRFFKEEFPLQINARLTKGGQRLQIVLETWSRLIVPYPQSGANGKHDAPKGMEGKPILERLELTIPGSWKVKETDGYFDQAQWTVVWRKKPMYPGMPLSFFIEFHPEPIEGSDDVSSADDHCLRGSYEVAIEDWTVSGLHVAQDVSAHSKHFVRPPNGLVWTKEDDKEGWMTPVVKHKTLIAGTLTLDPAYLSCQQVQVISDALEEQEPQPEVTSQEKLLVAPSFHVVNAIVDTLAAKEVFIKQVTETPGYMTETQVHSNQVRYWEIQGTYYQDGSLQPVVLHLVITGEEPRHNRPNCYGTLHFQLSLRSYSGVHKDGEETYAMLRQRHANFRELIRQAAYQGRQVDYQGRRVVAWRQEQHIEEELQDDYPFMAEVAAVLSSNEGSKLGHIFFVANGDYQGEDLKLLQEQWHLCRKVDLPRVATLGDNSVDKWQLLREAEEGLNGQ
jgi:hypothetical protein